MDNETFKISIEAYETKYEISKPYSDVNATDVGEMLVYLLKGSGWQKEQIDEILETARLNNT